MRVSIDWITVKLTPDFNIDNWRNAASVPLVSRETGEQVGIACPEKYWKFNRYAGEDYISAYGLGTNTLCYYANLHDLRVSRIDVAVDVDIQGEPLQALEEMRQKIALYYETKGITISTGDFSGREKRAKGSRTFTFGKQSSDYQLRLYNRRKDNSQSGWYSRCEFQLRHDLAKAFWQEARADYEDPLTLRNCAAQVERTIFDCGLLGIGDLEQDSKLELPDKPKEHNTALWVRETVLKAIIRHFNETGVNLAQALVEDFNNYITSHGIVLANDPFSSNDSEDQSSSKALNPMHYTGTRRRDAALLRWFSDSESEAT